MDLQHEADRRVVAVIGDGSMTGGMAYEALNNLGHSGRRVLIVLNDNGRSYAPTVSRLAAGLTRLRLNPSYVKSRDRIQRMLRGVPGIGEHLELGLEGMRAASREVLGSGGFFEALGVRYIGPVDGHDIAAAGAHPAPGGRARRARSSSTSSPRRAGATSRPRTTTRSASTTPRSSTRPPARRRGCPPATPRPSPTPSSPPAAPTPTSSPSPRPWPAPPACSRSRPATPTASSTSASPSSTPSPPRPGMAMGGLRPVVAIYSTFLTRAFDQVNLDVGLHRLPVVFAIDRAGITGDDGPSHHGVLDMALLSKVPGMTVFAPSSAQEVEVMLTEALSIADGPCAIRYPKGPARQVPPDEVGSGLSARLLQRGDDVCILAVGKMVEAAEEAARLLEPAGRRRPRSGTCGWSSPSTR